VLVRPILVAFTAGTEPVAGSRHRRPKFCAVPDPAAGGAGPGWPGDGPAMALFVRIGPYDRTVGLLWTPVAPAGIRRRRGHVRSVAGVRSRPSAMSLPAGQRRALDQIEKALADDHPGLGPLFAGFTRQIGHAAMPPTERVPSWPRRWQQRIPPGVAAAAVLALAAGAFLVLSLLLPAPPKCVSRPVFAGQTATQSAPAGRPSSCVTGQSKPSGTTPSAQAGPSSTHS
jgi:hypothetical protein